MHQIIIEIKIPCRQHRDCLYRFLSRSPTVGEVQLLPVRLPNILKCMILERNWRKRYEIPTFSFSSLRFNVFFNTLIVLA